MPDKLPEKRLSPSYIALLESGGMNKRIKEAEVVLRDCHLCGNNCGIDRTVRPGPCRIGDKIVIASYGPHHGEESVLSGTGGSGTIFFSGCNLHCVYCQNYDISQTLEGTQVTPDDLAHMMLTLQKRGCHNINLVSPTHIAAHIVPALAIAAQAGLIIPIVYNTGGYDSSQSLALMDGLVDIYMPDMKYSDAETAERLSGVLNYPCVNRAAVKEMHRQVGDLTLDECAIARQGLLVRHLVLPGGLAGTAEVSRFLTEEVSPDTFINIMDQYHPAYKARDYTANDSPLDQRISLKEYQKALSQARKVGLDRFSR